MTILTGVASTVLLRRLRWALPIVLPLTMLLPGCGIFEELGIIPSVTIEPANVTLAPGETVVFTATTQGDHELVWESPFGSVTGSGRTITYTAPLDVAGPIDVVARRADEPHKHGAARIIVEDDFSQDLLYYSSGRVVRLKVENIPMTWEFHQVTQLLYQEFEDAFDFIFVFRLGIDNICGYVSVAQRIEGIGLPQADRTLTYGSAGRLIGMPYIGMAAESVPGPLSFPYRLVAQSMTKAWGNWIVEAPIKDYAWRTQPYWGFTSAGGLMGGFDRTTLRDLGGGQYAASADVGGSYFTATWASYRPYSPIELYLMGLVPAAEVPPLLVAIDPSWVDQPSGRFSASGFTEHTIDDIIAMHGPRSPSASSAPVGLRALSVIVTEVPLTEKSWEPIDRGIAAFGRDGSTPRSQASPLSFRELTGGRATLQVDDAFGARR
jgi:hypothetical protein